MTLTKITFTRRGSEKTGYSAVRQAIHWSRARRVLAHRVAGRDSTHCRRSATRSPTGIEGKSVSETERFIPVSGVVHHQTSLGVFLEVARRRVFIPANCMSAPSAVFETGEPAVLLVLRRFAEEEGVTPSAKSRNDNVHERSPSTIQSSVKNKDPKTKGSSRSRLFQGLIAMCVVETTAAAQSGMSSWKTKPCRLILRLLTKRASS
jgi:hypothetical protein